MNDVEYLINDKALPVFSRLNKSFMQTQNCKPGQCNTKGSNGSHENEK